MKQRFVLLILVIASLIAVQCGGSPPATEAPAPTKAPPTEAPATEEVPTMLDGKSLLEERCTRCHDLGGVERAKKTEEEWKATVERMVGKGAMLSQAEQELVIQYLAETYPK
jgi:cytochrome c5